MLLERDRLAHLEIPVKPRAAELEDLGADRHPGLQPFVARMENRLDAVERLRRIERSGDLRLATLDAHLRCLRLCHRHPSVRPEV